MSEGKCRWVRVEHLIERPQAGKVYEVRGIWPETLARETKQLQWTGVSRVWRTLAGFEVEGFVASYWLKVEIEPPDEPSGERDTVRCEVHRTTTGHWGMYPGKERVFNMGGGTDMLEAINHAMFAYIEDQHGNRWRGMPGWCRNDDPRKVCVALSGDGGYALDKWHAAVPVAVHFWKTKEQGS